MEIEETLETEEMYKTEETSETEETKETYKTEETGETEETEETMNSAWLLNKKPTKVKWLYAGLPLLDLKNWVFFIGNIGKFSSKYRTKI